MREEILQFVALNQFDFPADSRIRVLEFLVAGVELIDALEISAELVRTFEQFFFLRSQVHRVKVGGIICPELLRQMVFQLVCGFFSICL